MHTKPTRLFFRCFDTCIYLYGDDIDFNVEANFSQNLDCVGQAGGFASRG